MSRSAVAAWATAALLAGCAGVGTDAPGSPARVTGASSPLRVDVPFVAQPRWQCGPASLSMAMAAAGREVPVGRLSDAAFIPGRRGALQAEMLGAARREGLLATELPGTADAIRAELAAGRPVIVLQNLALSWWPTWHYAVVIGHDAARGQWLLHSGEEASLALSERTFDATWARAGRWAIAVTPPDALPASATEPAALRAAAGLERADPAAAARAWGAVAARFPSSRLARFGLGNRLLADGDARGAAEAYRAAIGIDPRFADAWNNLAQALSRAGERDAAREAAERAVALGGPHADAYRDTLASLVR